jgi:hypothetical protein
MKQRLDQLADNNTAIVTLIKAYSPQVKTAAFTTAADKFRNYALCVARPVELGHGALYGRWQLRSIGSCVSEGIP